VINSIYKMKKLFFLFILNVVFFNERLLAQRSFENICIDFFQHVKGQDIEKVAKEGDIIIAELEKGGVIDTSHRSYYFFTACAHSSLGDNLKAENCFLRLVDIFQASMATKHFDYALTLNYLAHLYSKIGEYPKSLELNLKVREIIEELYDRSHAQFAAIQSDLADDYFNLGDYALSLELHEESLRLTKRIFGSENETYCERLIKLADFFSFLSEYNKSLELNLEGLRIYDKLYGQMHKEYANQLSNVASDYLRTGNISMSIEAMQQCLSIREILLGKEHPHFASGLSQLALCYQENGEYSKSLDLNFEALRIREKLYGKKHELYALSLGKLASDYSNLGDKNQSLKLFMECLEIEERILGENHPSYILTLNNIALVYADLGNFSKSIELNLKCLKKNEILYGKDHPDYAMSLNNLALCYSESGDHHKSLSYNLDALAIIEKKYGTNNRDYAMILNNVASDYYKIGSYTRSIELNEKCMEIRGRILGENHPDYAMSVGNLALGYSAMGDYQRSLELNIECVKLREKCLGKDHPTYALSINNLSLNYYDLGEYSKSIELNDICLKIYENLYGKRNKDYALVLNNLALNFGKLGKYAESIQLNNECLNIYEELYGVESIEYARSLNNIALNFCNARDFEKSIEYNLECLRIWEKLIGKDHPDYITCLSNLALDYYYLGEFSKSLDLNNECFEIRNRLYGYKHPSSVMTLNNIALNYFALGQNSKAIESFKNCLNAYESIMGREHVDYYECLKNLASAYILLGDFEGADHTMHEAIELSQKLIMNELGLGSDLKSSYKVRFMDLHNCYLNYLKLKDKPTEKQSAEAFNGWLVLNGWIGDYGVLLSREVEGIVDGDLLALYEEYKKFRIELNLCSGHGLADQAKYDFHPRPDEEFLRSIENQLTMRSSSFKRLNAVYDYRNLQEQLNSDEAYIDFHRVPYYDFRNQTWMDSSFYIAYLVTKDTYEAQLLYYLGDGNRIDEILYPYIVSQTTNPSSATMDEQVYNLLWKPIEEHLTGKTKIYLSPGGVYHSINPETIYHAETGKYLFEEKEIHLVSSGRSFVDQRIYGNRDYTDRTALIMGAPNFDYSYVADSTLLEDNVSFTYQTMRDLSLDGNRRAAPLPATRSEVEGINQTLASTAWNTQLLTGNDALEGSLKQMESPRILHIATHGYFLEDIKPENDNGMRMMGMDVNRVAENSMLRSGLLLAGCNKTLADNTPLTGGDNGILTAYEAALLDLSKTELVVLSACETGKGEILNGEGVQGLRKAMTDAGAEHILMSLWKVDDKVTSEYMQTFYGHYAQGKSICESYNLTRNEIKQKYPQPYYWGAFVLIGE